MLLFYELKQKILKAEIIKDRILVIIFFAALLINIGLFVFLYYKIPQLVSLMKTDIITLHYNIYFGGDYIGDSGKIFSLPILGFMIFLINTILAFFLYIRAKILSYYLAIISLICQIILFFCEYLILLFNK